jgi:phosphatidate cytidylyltransferase
MLKTRIITAVLLLLGLFALVFFAPVKLWAFICLVLTLLALREWSGFIALNELHNYSFMLLALIFGASILMSPESTYGQYQNVVTLFLLGFASFFWIVIAPVWLLRNKVFNNRFIMAALGLLLIIATTQALVGLRAISPWLLLGIVVAVSIADSCAYFAGKRFGKRKLAAEISPGKTWEGVYGAILGVTIYGIVLCYSQGYSFWLIISLWLLVVLSIIGDLIESLLKRKAGLKDSGALLPGHGGILDRIDGLLPTLTVTLFCIYLPLFSGFGLNR